MQMFLGCTGTAARLSCSWSAVGAGCSIIISWYLPGRCSKTLRLALRRAAVIGWLAVLGWIPCRLLQLVARTQTPHSAVQFGGEDADSMLLGKRTDTFPLGSGEPATESNLVTACCVYIVLATTILLSGVKRFCTQEVPLLNISNNEILHYILKKNF